MGALAPVTQWVPNDDLLLKNAVEAGASLESLAKGAIQFSRRYSIRELQERWHSLLYDPIISTEAAVKMIELERAPSSVPSKSSKADASKDNKSSNGKRKVDSVRKCYYAMRKRIRSDPLNHDDLNFLVPPGDSCFVDGAGPPCPSNMLGDPVANNFGLDSANFGNMDVVFSQGMGHCAPPCHDGEFPIGPENNLDFPLVIDTIPRDVPHMLPNGMGINGHCSGINQMCTSKELTGHTIFEANVVEAEAGCCRDVMCSVSGRGKILNSSAPVGEPSYHLEYASVSPRIPDWTEMPGDVCMTGNGVQVSGPFSILDDDGCVASGAPDYNVICRETQLNNHMSSSDFKNSTGCSPDHYGPINNTFFDFSADTDLLIEEDGELLIHGEGELLIDGEGELLMDGNGGTEYENGEEYALLGSISNILLYSPDKEEEGDDLMLDTEDPTEFSACISNGCSPVLEDTIIAGDACKINVQSNAERQYPETVHTVNPEFPELRDGVICCTLNTEDPDIPCNDDIVFPSKPKTTTSNRRTQSDAKNMTVLGKDNTAGEASDKSTLKKELKRVGQAHPASQTRVADAGLTHKINDSGVKNEAPRGDSVGEPVNPGTTGGVPYQSSLNVKKETSDVLVRQASCNVAEKAGQMSDLAHLQNGVGVNIQEGDTRSASKQELCVVGAVDSVAAVPIGESLLESEEHFSESDTEVPYYSDIEAMVLDMDLGPGDPDSFSVREVAKYQHEDAMRTIIRLELNAHSYMQRAIAAHGAFAVLYGDPSKHYIKKPEVLLGRATDDIIVDIDLAREGRANKISRRQATIKLDKDGIFNMKNLGKCPIYVNKKEISPGQCLNLHSDCLIEIRDISFIFEVNQTRVQRYLDNAA